MSRVEKQEFQNCRGTLTYVHAREEAGWFPRIQFVLGSPVLDTQGESIL